LGKSLKHPTASSSLRARREMLNDANEEYGCQLTRQFRQHMRLHSLRAVLIFIFENDLLVDELKQATLLNIFLNKFLFIPFERNVKF
jgi:hypothetical protein